MLINEPKVKVDRKNKLGFSCEDLIKQNIHIGPNVKIPNH